MAAKATGRTATSRAAKAPARKAPAKAAPRKRAPRPVAQAALPAEEELDAGDEAVELGAVELGGELVVDETADVPELAGVEVPAALTFTTPADPETAERVQDPGTPFVLDGERYLAYQPKKAVRAMLFAAAAQSASDADRINAVLTWCDAALSGLAVMRIKQRLLDRTDHLSVDHLVDVMNGLTAYWDAQHSRAGRRAADRLSAPAGAGGRRLPR